MDNQSYKTKDKCMNLLFHTHHIGPNYQMVPHSGNLTQQQKNMLRVSDHRLL